MTDPTYTHYVLLIDRTGSMSAIRAETEQGIRHFVDEQRKLTPEGERATLSLYEFDAWQDPGDSAMVTKVGTVEDFTSLNGVKDYYLSPRGYTPLLDAVGITMTQTGEKLAAMAEDQRPGKVYFVIATDGGENWSREWTRQRVRDLITQQQEQYGWQIVYIGANQDAFAEAGGIGIHAQGTMNYAATRSGAQSAWSTTSSAVARSRAGGQSVSYTADERDQSSR